MNQLENEDKNQGGSECSEDLVGAPFAVIESDPAVFTALMQKLGVIGLEAQEIFSLDFMDPTLSPYGLILCSKWREEPSEKEERISNDLDENSPWFANQLSDDSCATLALLNVLLNCEDVEIGTTLESFKEFTTQMDPIMRGLTIASSSVLRHVHNSFARPADIRASFSQIADVTVNAKKSTTKGKQRKKLNYSSSKRKKKSSNEDSLDAYHFISYVPYRGRVWEMDGLKKQPLECAEHEKGSTTQTWIDAVGPALRGRMDALSTGGDIRFNLLALVPCAYQTKMDDFELGKREVIFLERRLKAELGDKWEAMMPEKLLNLRNIAFSKPASTRLGLGFGARSNELAAKILRMDRDRDTLIDAWKSSVDQLGYLYTPIEEELERGGRSVSEHLKRTHDYEPFIRAYLAKLNNRGLLRDLLEVDGSGQPMRKPQTRQPSQVKQVD